MTRMTGTTGTTGTMRMTGGAKDGWSEATARAIY